MTPEQRAFLDGIIAHPDDIDRRWVYADWLDDHGDPDRAEFIRIQLSKKWSRREDLLLYNNWREWLGCSHPEVFIGTIDGFRIIVVENKPPSAMEENRSTTYESYQFHDGFVHTIRLPAETWRVIGPRLVANHPVRYVWATDAEPRRYITTSPLNHYWISGYRDGHFMNRYPWDLITDWGPKLNEAECYHEMSKAMLEWARRPNQRLTGGTWNV